VTEDLEAFSRAWETFFRATRRRRARHEAVDDGPLTIPQYLLLEPLLGGEALAVRDLAEQAGVTPPTATARPPASSAPGTRNISRRKVSPSAANVSRSAPRCTGLNSCGILRRRRTRRPPA